MERMIQPVVDQNEGVDIKKVAQAVVDNAEDVITNDISVELARVLGDLLEDPYCGSRIEQCAKGMARMQGVDVDLVETAVGALRIIEPFVAAQCHSKAYGLN